MNEDRKKRGIIHSKFLTAITITALFLGSGEAMAKKNIPNSNYSANEQQQSPTIQRLIVDIQNIDLYSVTC